MQNSQGPEFAGLTSQVNSGYASSNARRISPETLCGSCLRLDWMRFVFAASQSQNLRDPPFLPNNPNTHLLPRKHPGPVPPDDILVPRNSGAPEPLTTAAAIRRLPRSKMINVPGILPYRNSTEPQCRLGAAAVVGHDPPPLVLQHLVALAGALFCGRVMERLLGGRHLLR